MKATIKVEKEVEIKTLCISANVRYWGDSEINNVSDEDGTLTPWRIGDLWNPVVDIDSGVIQDWPKGTIANIHFNICDNGCYYLNDEDGETVLSIENDYVPKIACPGDEDYGDYIIMDIDGNGKIDRWNPTIDDFFDDEDE